MKFSNNFQFYFDIVIRYSYYESLASVPFIHVQKRNFNYNLLNSNLLISDFN